jgi:hypothetical protein
MSRTEYPGWNAEWLSFGNVLVGRIFEFVKLELCSDHFPSWLHQPEGINKDPTVWLDGARPPPKYVFKNNVILANSKFWHTQTLHQFIHLCYFVVLIRPFFKCHTAWPFSALFVPLSVICHFVDHHSAWVSCCLNVILLGVRMLGIIFLGVILCLLSFCFMELNIVVLCLLLFTLCHFVKRHSAWVAFYFMSFCSVWFCLVSLFLLLFWLVSF